MMAAAAVAVPAVVVAPTPATAAVVAAPSATSGVAFVCVPVVLVETASVDLPDSSL
jgi:hypothetical protein